LKEAHIVDGFMNFLNWAFVEPFWDVIDVFRWIFRTLFGVTF
jgi:hypothetical protein